MTSRKLTEQKVEQIIYAGDAYDAAEVFNADEYARAKLMFNDYSSHPQADPLVKERAETATERIEEVQD